MTIPEVELFEFVDELPPHTPLLGGRVVIDVRIGRGGAATVYAGTTADGRDVAVKIMTAEYAELASSRQRFRNEFALAQHLAGHPRIAVPYEQGELPELGGRPYILMPLVKGRPMLLLVGRLPVVEAVALLRDLALVVADVHARGIIHRDIKPGNVIVSDQGGVRAPVLLDFGLAYSHGQSSAPATVGLTAAHELPGTKHYMAPEQILGAPPDPRFDVYALGVTMHEVLVGVVPLHELSPADAARRKCDASLPSLSIVGRAPGVPRELEQVVDAALERDPERRTASAEQFAEGLTEVLVLMQRRRSVPLVLAVAEGETQRETEPDGPRVAAKPAIADDGRGAARDERGIPWRMLAAAAAVLVMLLGVGLAMRDSVEPRRATEAAGQAAGDIDPAGVAASGVGILDAGGAGEAAAETGEPAGVRPEEGAPSPRGIPEPVEAEVQPVRERPRKGRKPKAIPEPGTQSSCEGVEEAANAANRAKDWRRVIDLTDSRGCWPDASARIRLRVRAFSELGRNAECATLGLTSTDAAVKRIANHCRKQIDTESNTP